MRIDRVVMAVDGNPLYLPFLPLVVRAWRRRMSIVPTIALIGEVAVDPSIRDAEFVRIPAAGIPSGAAAQIARLLVPALFPGEVSLISDIDIVPLRNRYFTAALHPVRDDKFVVFRDAAYAPAEPRYPMCYNAARGETFGEVFGVRSHEDIGPALARMIGEDLGWNADELLLYRGLQAWNAAPQRLMRLGHGVRSRIDRSRWTYHAWMVPWGRYIDAHLPRPYADHRAAIDRLAAAAGFA